MPQSIAHHPAAALCHNPRVAHSPFISFLLLGAGIVLLYYGGDHLVDGAANLARSFGLSSMVIGLTVVAFGTSAPELAASLTATLKGAPEIALGNVIGSNIANLALVLAVAAMIKPMLVEATFIRREVPFMILVSLLLGVLIHQGLLVRWAGAAMLLLLALYLWFLLRAGDQDVDIPELAEEPPKPAWSALRVALGVALLALGARVLVEGALGAAHSLGISERVIGLTLVALGTSLPELATVVRPMNIPFQEVRLDLAVMTAISISILPMLYFYGRIGRKRGALLLTSYVVYIVALFV
jgi:cation:H+ antiporter